MTLFQIVIVDFFESLIIVDLHLGKLSTTDKVLAVAGMVNSLILVILVEYDFLKIEAVWRLPSDHAAIDTCSHESLGQLQALTLLPRDACDHPCFKLLHLLSFQSVVDTQSAAVVSHGEETTIWAEFRSIWLDFLTTLNDKSAFGSGEYPIIRLNWTVRCSFSFISLNVQMTGIALDFNLSEHLACCFSFSEHSY